MAHYNFTPGSPTNPHFFLAEDILVPRANCSDTQRLNMWSSHFPQIVHLVKPERPKVFTNFENQVGKYSIAYKKAEKKFKIIDKIVKNAYNYILVVQYEETGVYDIIKYDGAVNITEDYGYQVHDRISDAEPGDIIDKDTTVYSSSNYDEEMNFMYGTNLKTAFIPWKNFTYEDGIVISESAAKKLASHKVEKVFVSINTNDVLLNIYGDNTSYKSFPKIGDVLNNRTLVASRRVDHRTSMYSFQNGRIDRINPLTDEIMYSNGGTCVDIDIFSNVTPEAIRNRRNEFAYELADALEEQNNFWTKVKESLEKIIPLKVLTDAEMDKDIRDGGHVIDHPIARKDNPNKYTDEVGYYWKLSHEKIDNNIKYRSDGKKFENVKIEFTLLKHSTVTKGVKLTGRYGNKGVVSYIEADENMPIGENGERVEACCNGLGVINRGNFSQWHEVHINFMINNMIGIMKSRNDRVKNEALMFGVLGILNPTYSNFIASSYYTMSDEEKKDFMNNIYEEGLPIHQQPFFGNTTFEDFKRLLVEYPEIHREHVCAGISRPQVIGEMYFVRLKHESANKFSARSTGKTNIKNLPSKSMLRKEKKIPHSQTPIRLGEMEVVSLLLGRSDETVVKLLRSYATTDSDRNGLISDLLNAKNPFDIDIHISDEPSNNRKILDKYLSVLDLEIED